MKKYRSKILTAVGMALALAAFFFMLFAPVAVSKSEYASVCPEVSSVNGLDIIFGSAPWGSKINLLLRDGYHVVSMGITGFGFSIRNSSPHFSLIVGIVVFGILAILDNKKLGTACSIVMLVLFFIASIVILFLSKSAFPTYELKEVTENIPSDIMLKLEMEGIISFNQIFNFEIAWGAVISSACSLVASILTAIGLGLKLSAHKREKILKAQ